MRIFLHLLVFDIMLGLCEQFEDEVLVHIRRCAGNEDHAGEHMVW